MIEQQQIVELINSINLNSLLKSKLEEQIIFLIFDDDDIMQAIKAQILDVINNDTEGLNHLILNELKSYLEDNMMDLVDTSDLMSLVMSLVNSRLGGKNE